MVSINYISFNQELKIAIMVEHGCHQGQNSWQHNHSQTLISAPTTLYNTPSSYPQNILKSPTQHQNGTLFFHTSFVPVANHNHPCHCCANPKPTQKLRKPVSDPPECSTCVGEAASLGVGLQTGTLRPVVRKPEAQWLCAGAFEWTLRWEHILGQWHGVEASTSCYCMGWGASMVQLLAQFLCGWTDVWTLYPDCVEHY